MKFLLLQSLNIFYGKGKVCSVININELTIALCTDNGIEVYNKDTHQLIYEISKPKESHEYAVLASPIVGIAK